MTSYDNNSVVSFNRPKVRLRKIYVYPQSLPKLVNHKCLWNLGKQWQAKYGSWSVDVLYSAGYTFIDIWRAIPATKLLTTSCYKLGFYRYSWGSRVFRNITADIHIDSGMTQYDTATSRMFLKVTLQKSINTPDTNTRKHCMIHSLSQQHMKM